MEEFKDGFILSNERLDVDKYKKNPTQNKSTLILENIFI